jgi:hypothetical protein
MENVVTYIPIYVIALIVEFIVFFGYVYFVSVKTEGGVSRRWKASAFISVCCGLLVHVSILGAIVLGWLIETNIEIFLISLPEKVMSFFANAIAVGAIVTMPVVMIGLFMAYFHLWQTGDRFVEKYWRNPKVHYGENGKPPFLKF